MTGPHDTSANVTSGDQQLTFAITAYESSNVYTRGDVHQPAITLFNEQTYESVTHKLAVDASNQLDPTSVVITGLTNNVEYFWEVVTNTNVDASGRATGTHTPLGAPGQAVLGDATYPQGGGIKIPVTIDPLGNTIDKYKVQVYNTGTNKSTTKYFKSGNAVFDDELSKGYILITDTDWSSLENTSSRFSIFIQAAPSNGLYSPVASRQYSLFPVPSAPDSFTMDDSTNPGEGLFATVTVDLNKYPKLSGANYFIDIDACGNDQNTWNNVVSQQMFHDKTSYTFPVYAPLGVMQTYKARVREVLPDKNLYSDYFTNSVAIMNEYYQAGTLVATQLVNSGSNPTYPATTFDYFKLSYAGGTSSFGSRYIVSGEIDVSGTDIAGSVDVSGISPAANGSGNHAIPADGNLDLYCYVQHMQLNDSADDNRTFSIDVSGVKGEYSAAQKRAGASSSAQDINSAKILSNTIIERTPLEKPDAVKSVKVVAGNQQLAATWDVDSPTTGQNKTATSFEVSLYLANNTNSALQVIQTSNYNYTFINLTNDVNYIIAVVAKNAAGSSGEKLSSQLAPATTVLPNDTIFNIQLSDVPKSGGTKVYMTCNVNKPSGYRIDTIEIESISAYGVTGSLVDVSAANQNTGFAGPVSRKLVQDITATDYNGIHRYRFRAVSNKVDSPLNEHGSIVHNTIKSEWEYAQINLTQKPRITAFTYKQNSASNWAAKSTDIVVTAMARGLAIEEATTNVIAIPAVTDGLNMNIKNIVHNLQNPVYNASDSTYTYKLTLDYHLLDMDASGTTNDIAAVALVTNAKGQAVDSQPQKA
jgi:hypothetical protein